MSDDSAVVVTAEAKNTIRNMLAEVERLSSEIGHGSLEHHRAALSLAETLGRMITFDGLSKISSDGDLDLLCETPWITFGVNYTGSSYNVNRAGTWSINS